jgi:anti-sigma regulatory factor (Ser/Thr protein kinase)/serine/threonine protein phosphatase PrpC
VAEEKVMQPQSQVIAISHASDVSAARRAAQAVSSALGFAAGEVDELALVVSELATNLLKYAQGGTLTLTSLEASGRIGVQVESHDRGPGIADVEQAMTDGFSTAGSLGYGLGTVNRLMEALEVRSEPGRGTYIVCQRWRRLHLHNPLPCPLEFGAATRAHPRMEMNGDAFVIKRWQESALVGVIDGLGHGQFAHRAAQTARRYIESHCDRPLAELFRGVGRACHATRGVVMALVRFDWAQEKLTFASIGNVEVRVLGNAEPMNFMVRRGVVGLNAPNPVVTEHHWDPRHVMVLHSDGLTIHWRWQDFPDLAALSATLMAQRLLRALARGEDDATVVVVRDAVL